MPLKLSESDQALERRQFHIDDPQTLENLTAALPKRADEPIVEYRYDMTPPKAVADRKYTGWCAHCKKFNHWIGYVMLHDDGSRFTCGHQCGEKIYGIAFKRIENKFKAAVDRQSSIRWLNATLRLLPALVTAVREFSKDPGYRTLEQFQRELEYRMPGLADGLRTVAKQKQPGLSVVASYRDHDAEDERKARNAERQEQRKGLSRQEKKTLRRAGKLEPIEDESKPIFKKAEQWLGVLDGPILFSKRFELQAARFSEFADELRDLYARFADRDSDSVRKKDIDRALRDLETILGNIKRLIKDLATAKAFFLPATLDRVLTWATQDYERLGGGYRIEKGVLIFSPHSGDREEITLQLPTSVRLPTSKVIHEFERSVSSNYERVNRM